MEVYSAKVCINRRCHPSDIRKPVDWLGRVSGRYQVYRSITGNLSRARLLLRAR